MKRIAFTTLLILTTFAAMAQKPQKITQTAGRQALGEFAPEFAHLNDDILFGEVWSRNDKLSLRDRSLVTVVALMSQGLTDSSLKYHLTEAKKNGITREEIAEILTHAAFYAGWPKAWATFNLAKEVWTENAGTAGGSKDGSCCDAAKNAGTDAYNEAKAAFEKQMLFPIGAPNTGFAQYFTGQSWLAPVSTEQIHAFNVTFEPGCRNNWHIHHATKGGGQVLICIAGRGWYQEWGKPARELHPGDVVNIPAGVKHWHGAAADSWFAHLAVEVDGEQTSNEWLERVSDEDYAKL